MSGKGVIPATTMAGGLTESRWRSSSHVYAYLRMLKLYENVCWWNSQMSPIEQLYFSTQSMSIIFLEKKVKITRAIKTNVGTSSSIRDKIVYPLVIMENGPVEIVDLPIDSMVVFHSYVIVYQRVTSFFWHVRSTPSMSPQRRHFKMFGHSDTEPSWRCIRIQSTPNLCGLSGLDSNGAHQGWQHVTCPVGENVISIITYSYHGLCLFTIMCFHYYHCYYYVLSLLLLYIITIIIINYYYYHYYY